MPNLKEIITFEYESAYDCAYDLPVKKIIPPQRSIPQKAIYKNVGTYISLIEIQKLEN